MCCCSIGGKHMGPAVDAADQTTHGTCTATHQRLPDCQCREQTNTGKEY